MSRNPKSDDNPPNLEGSLESFLKTRQGSLATIEKLKTLIAAHKARLAAKKKKNLDEGNLGIQSIGKAAGAKETYFREFINSVKQLAEAKGISNKEALKEMVLSEGLEHAITKIKKKLTVGKRINAIEKRIASDLSASYHTNKPWNAQHRRRLDLAQRSIRTFDIETKRTPTDDHNRGPYMKRKWKTVVPLKQKAITKD